jgi:lipopolysaccharide/colanic/teichoic acid biosynthesis glycosyltransferase
MQQLNVQTSLRIRIVSCVWSDEGKTAIEYFQELTDINRFESLSTLESFLSEQSLLSIPEVLVLELDEHERCFNLVKKLQSNIVLKGLLIVLLAPVRNHSWVQNAKQLKVHDYYHAPYPAEDIYDRLNFLVKFKLLKPALSVLVKDEFTNVKLPFSKRLFDKCFALSFLILLSPVLLLVAILIRLESKGPIIYKSKRVGTGFKVFDFYKFRSMYKDADKRLKELETQNQYGPEDGNKKAAFLKFRNDPRITRVGKFIRNTSIDELPQLFNILKGDMSAVGNRPLPLYEAEMLTSNEWTWRFLAPAGLTGLWQVSRRGRPEMSERERKKLDNFYAKKHSMLFDLKILARTLPATFQKNDV